MSKTVATTKLMQCECWNRPALVCPTWKYSFSDTYALCRISVSVGTLRRAVTGRKR